MSAAGVWTDATERRLVTLFADSSNLSYLRRTTTNNQLSWQYTAGGTSKTVTLTTAGPVGWQHIALTISKTADQMIAYINGAQTGATQTGLGTWVGALSNTRTVLGASITTPLTVWSGYLAHAALWSTPLSAAQVAALAVSSG